MPCSKDSVGFRTAGQDNDHVIGVREFFFDPVEGDHPVNVGVACETVGIALDRGNSSSEGFQKLGHGLAQRSKPDYQHSLIEKRNTIAVTEAAPDPVLLVCKRLSDMPVEVKHHREQAFAHDTAMEAAVKCLHTAARVCGYPIMPGGRGKKRLQFRCAFIPVGFEYPGQGTIGFRKLFKKSIGPFGNGNARVGKKLANQINMARLERKGIYAVVKMDKEVVNFHGGTRKELFHIYLRSTVVRLTGWLFGPVVPIAGISFLNYYLQIQEFKYISKIYIILEADHENCKIISKWAKPSSQTSQRVSF